MAVQMTAFRYTCSGLLLLLLAACATTRPEPPAQGTGDATWHAVPPPGITRYTLSMGDISSGANLIDRVAPVYPPGLLVACPAPVEVTALLIVNRSGKVSEVRVAHEADADANQRPFIAATRAAARQWLFNPLLIKHWAADADGNSHVVDSVIQPFSLTYVFRFECHAGNTHVSSERAADA
jgi:hypothetical protein